MNDNRNFRPKDTQAPFQQMLRSMTRSATGISNQKSAYNMGLAKSPENILARAQSLADQGMNIKKGPASQLDRYLKKFRYISRFVPVKR